MKIRTQFVISMVLFGIILTVIAASLFVTNQRGDRVSRQEDLANDIERGARELGYLSSDYLLYRESQQRTRWEAKFVLLSADLSNLKPDTPEEQALVKSIVASQQRLRAIFADLVPAAEFARQTQGVADEMAFFQVSWSRMEVQTQGMVFDALRLSQILHEEDDQLRETNLRLILILVAIFGAYFLTNYLIIYRRTLRSIADLRAGTAIIGSGNLDFAIPVQRNDEIGELSLAFNRMAASLKGVTASKGELEREMAERKRAEERANRQKATQEGINRILEAALTCDTEQELGRTSLLVAEELTGSKFGFIAELNPQELLDDIAISDPGWELCKMETRVGRGKLLHMTIHGIYGRVIQDGKAFFTNDPSAHPDRIGTPEDHPSLTAFLGVPLASGGKTFGMVGLGNRDGGYRVEDQEAAVSLASAIVEAFERMRAEEEIRQLNESLSQRAAELEVSNKELEAFAYSVSHDLRAPLRHIDGFGKILLEKYAGELDEQGRRYLQVIGKATKTMGQLIDDLLKLSRVTRAELRRQSVNLSEIAESILAELRVEQPERQVDTAVASDVVVDADPQLLRIVLDNLLGNAWKFTARRPVASIEVGVTWQDDKPAYYVKDNGAGFDMAYAGKLFGAFQRLHSAKEFTGSGIGLATVQRIIHRHRGRVWAEGVVDKGATFYFTL